MKKSSLGRRSSTAGTTSRKTSDFMDKGVRSCIPLPSSSGSSAARKRDASGDRVSDYGSVQHPSGTLRTPRTMTMSSGRASSFGNSKKTDNRPLQDREWQIRAMESIQMSLNLDEEGCDILATCGTLKPMTLVNFINMADYFVRKLDPRMQVNKANYLTELVFILKKLQYKGKADKTMLQTVNTMHNWPHALGILQFLAALAQASEDFRRLSLDPLYPETIEPDSAQDEKLNFKYVVPLLHYLWDQSKKEDMDIESLVAANKDKVYQALALSGFTQDVFDQEKEAHRELEEANKEYQEAQDKFNRLDQQYAAATERLADIELKAAAERAIVHTLQVKLEEQHNKQADLQRHIAFIEEECKMKQELLDNYEAQDPNEPSPQEYEEYQESKRTLQGAIEGEKEVLYQLSEHLFDEKMKTVQLESECDSLFKEYNRLISEVLKEDVSVRGAVCCTRPKMGATPCNEATAQLLAKVLGGYEQRIAQMECELSRSDLTDEFDQEEEMKTKMAVLQQIQTIQDEAVIHHQQAMAKLQKELERVDKENTEVNEQLQTTEEELKLNLQQYEQLESEIKLKEGRLEKFHSICQRKLELRYKSIVELDRKTQAKLDQVAAEAKSLLEMISK